MNAVKKFKIKISPSELSHKEKLCLEKLISAAEMLSPLYLQQRNNKYPGANFYPHNASKEEIQAAAKKNPAILSPYTFVERDKSGKLIAVRYCSKFKKQLEKIARTLKEASSLSSDKKLKTYLNARAKDLLTDNYNKSNILWLKTEKSETCCVIGPFDRYLDKLFFRKRAYMAWVGTLDEKMTREAEKLVSIVLSSERKHLPGSKKAKIPQVKVRVENTAIFSGLIADFMFVGNNLPSSADIFLIKKYGTLFTIFKPTMRLRFDKWIFPIFKTLFAKDFQERYSHELLYQAFVRSIILHETCHSLMRYEDAATRLQELFPIFDELYTDILAVKCCATLYLKNGFTEKETQAFLIAYICRHLHWMTAFGRQPHLVHYATGGAISLNFLLNAKVTGRVDGVFRLDFSKLFVALDQLSNIIEYYLALGNHTEAKEFIKKYGSFRVFRKYFLPKLKRFLKE